MPRRALAWKAERQRTPDTGFARINLRGELDFGWALRFLALRMVPSLEVITPDGLERAVWLEAAGRGTEPPRVVTLAVHSRRAGQLVVRSAPAVLDARLRQMVIRMFDLEADLDEFAALARRDSVLGPVVAANPRGLRLPQLLDPFEALVRAILGQQVSVAAARTLTDRLVRRVAMPAPRLPPGDVIPIARPRYGFPRPEWIADLGPTKLRPIGLTRAKAAALHGAAVAVASGHLDLERLRDRAPGEADRELLALPGVGPWTAAYVRLRALGDRDAFPGSDLGLRRALAARGIAASKVEATAERWRPWRGYATLHLWHSLGHASELPS